jgi:hypothetical protein
VKDASEKVHESTIRKYTVLSRLSDLFAEEAVRLVKTVVSELHLPTAEKSIPPVDIGGIAGGVKYRHGDILLKLAVDERGLYGGDDLAGKAAAHELKGRLFIAYSLTISPQDVV